MAQILKRALDFLAALFLLLILSPLLLLLTLLVWVLMGSPVFFRQLRPGLNARPFTLVKFRTMTNACDSSGQLLAEDHRLTRFGKLMRRLSLDELPQFWNVLKGEMSLVGPRPLLMQYLPRYSAEQSRRHTLLPGITGWAQIHGRNLTSWEERLAYDVWYVDHWSFVLDCKILFRTVAQVLTGKGISPHNKATMPEFMGAGDAALPAETRFKRQASQ